MALDRSRVAFVGSATPAELLHRHQQASDVTNIACEAAPHYTACCNLVAQPVGETQPGYSRFTDPYPASLLDYSYSIVDSSLPLGTIAVFWALLLAMVIVLNREARTLVDQSGLWSRRKG